MPAGWDGFKPIDDPVSNYLKNSFLKVVDDAVIPAEEFFATSDKPVFIGPFEPITDQIFPVKKCPITCFSESTQNWIKAHSEQMQAPIDYFAAPLLVYMGSVIGKKRGVKVRPGTDWIEFPNLWGMIIGTPSKMKSPAMKAMLRPLMSLMNRGKHQYEEAHLHYMSLSDRWRILKKAKEDHLRKEVEKKLKNGETLLLQTIEELQIEKEPQAPVLKRYRTDDTTTEKLGELLRENPQGILLFRDELSGFLRSFEKQGRENDRPFFLESWSGKGDFHVDRIGRGSLYIPSLCISIMGSIQPGPLMRYVHAAVKGGDGDDGFIQRFQLMVWPEATKEWKLVQGMPLHDLEEEVIKIFEYLDRLDFDGEGEPC